MYSSACCPELPRGNKQSGQLEKHKNICITSLVHLFPSHCTYLSIRSWHLFSPPKKCPVLPDGHILTAAFVGMDKDRFSSMFIDNYQVIFPSGSDCKIHPSAGSVNESIHWCMNCALKIHSCITCSGVRFADRIFGAAAGVEFSVSVLSEYSQEKFNHYKDNFSLLPLELCS